MCRTSRITPERIQCRFESSRKRRCDVRSRPRCTLFSGQGPNADTAHRGLATHPAAYVTVQAFAAYFTGDWRTGTADAIAFIERARSQYRALMLTGRTGRPRRNASHRAGGREQSAGCLRAGPPAQWPKNGRNRDM
jgi:hypothetical protein